MVCVCVVWRGGCEGVYIHVMSVHLYTHTQSSVGRAVQRRGERRRGDARGTTAA